VLQICGGITASANSELKLMLDRIVAMLTRLGQRGYTVREDGGDYGIVGEANTHTDTEQGKVSN
jgi:hypothetical protein